MLTACARNAQAGTPCLVLLDGEVGIGKSAVLRQFVTGLKDFTILRALCDRTEVDIPFGVVTQLASRVRLTAGKDLPLLTGRPASDVSPFQVGDQLLTLLGRLQDVGPVAIVVDDV